MPDTRRCAPPRRLGLAVPDCWWRRGLHARRGTRGIEGARAAELEGRPTSRTQVANSFSAAAPGTATMADATAEHQPGYGPRAGRQFMARNLRRWTRSSRDMLPTASAALTR